MTTMPKIAFFGTPDRAVWALDAMEKAGLTPAVVVTQPDRPQGRNLEMTPPPAKVWATERSVPVLQPEKLSAPEFLEALKAHGCDLFVVIAYGKIIPQAVLDMPKFGTLNIHGSLLPKLRGASPIETAILNDEKETGVTIMLMDAQMDHGPILAMEKTILEPWPPKAQDLARTIVGKGAELLVSVIPKWIAGKITPTEQNHAEATFTKLIRKEDALIDLAGDPYLNFRKIQAYSTWPRAFFFAEKDDKKTRLIVTDATFADGKLTIRKVIPEGRKETDFDTLGK
jgi:methionyl-tRNA formyltransferase